MDSSEDPSKKTLRGCEHLADHLSFARQHVGCNGEEVDAVVLPQHPDKESKHDGEERAIQPGTLAASGVAGGWVPGSFNCIQGFLLGALHELASLLQLKTEQLLQLLDLDALGRLLDFGELLLLLCLSRVICWLSCRACWSWLIREGGS
ncbi:hypothetical protein PF010_g20571 [Phytophthora fragariae]|uniref:Uncharacterized protein n=1 Tax=Phytophthora fragariae TaxID=53985 RepID=A0A6A3X506_9STRA|nr:hypothetical protein PF010_g20571 [Phytophthora fragariae]KAE9196699.1 hypothetical protein PF002_g22980 [Phytophthora fragariae]